MPPNGAITPPFEPLPTSAHQPPALVTRNLRFAHLFSLFIAALTAVAAVAGLLRPENVYPTDVAQEAFQANDLATLLIGLPVLVLAQWLAGRGRLLGLLTWPGALLYGLYNYTVYLVGAPLTFFYPLFLLIVALSLYTLIGLLAVFDSAAIKVRLMGQVPEKAGGGVLMGLGLLFAVRALAVLIGAVNAGNTLPGPELGLAVADFLLAAAWVSGGLMLWQKRPLGYSGGPGLLFCGAMLFSGLIVILALRPFLDNEPLPLLDIGVVLLMSLLVFIPCGLFVRGIRHVS